MYCAFTARASSSSAAAVYLATIRSHTGRCSLRPSLLQPACIALNLSAQHGQSPVKDWYSALYHSLSQMSPDICVCRSATLCLHNSPSVSPVVCQDLQLACTRRPGMAAALAFHVIVLGCPYTFPVLGCQVEANDTICCAPANSALSAPFTCEHPTINLWPQTTRSDMHVHLRGSSQTLHHMGMGKPDGTDQSSADVLPR